MRLQAKPVPCLYNVQDPNTILPIDVLSSSTGTRITLVNPKPEIAEATEFWVTGHSLRSRVCGLEFRVLIWASGCVVVSKLWANTWCCSQRVNVRIS